jgi:hypothetical protein
MWKEETYPHHVPGATHKNHENHPSGSSVSPAEIRAASLQRYRYANPLARWVLLSQLTEY